MNHEKTEVIPLGNMMLEPTEISMNEISGIVKILGVHFTYNHQRFQEKNFESIEKSLKELLQSWSWRGLTLIGKIQVIKSFAIPKILYRVAIVSCKKSDFVKRISYFFVYLERQIQSKACSLDNASVNSSCAHPPPQATAGHLRALSVPGVGHQQSWHGPGVGHLPNPGLLTHMWFPTRNPNMKDFIAKDQQFVIDWIVCQGLDKLVEVFSILCISSLLIKAQLSLK